MNHIEDYEQIYNRMRKRRVFWLCAGVLVIIVSSVFHYMGDAERSAYTAGIALGILLAA